MNHLEEIKLRLSIEELVGSYVQLKKAGRNLRGLCPFHSEKSPSFMVSPEKGIAYCFGCQKGGDIFKFVELTENVGFGEAVKILAQKTNVTLPQKMPQVHSKRLKAIELNQMTVEFYQEQLEKNLELKDYFHKRGLTDESISHFQLGFAPNSFDQLKNHAAKKGHIIKDLIDAALVSQRSIADQSSYDRFRNRLIFPIFDHQGNAVALSGRIIGEGEPKYLNSPETVAYNKSMVLYGLNWAKGSVKTQDMAIFVEGYMDVIAAHQAGTKNVVATCGTAITPQQLKLIKRYTQNIAFAFDQDSAGMEATLRGIELAQMAELSISIISIPNGKDPDECIQEDPESWKKSVENPIGVMDFYFNYALRQFDKGNLEGRKNILNFLLPLIKPYRSEMEQSAYLSRLSIELRTDIKHLWNDLKNLKQKKQYSQQKNNEEVVAPKKNTFTREEFLLGFILSHPHLYSEVAENLIDNIALDESTVKFYTRLKKVYTLGSPIDLGHFREDLSGEEQEKIDIYSLLTEQFYPDFSEEAAKSEIQKLIKEINRGNLHKMQKECEFKIRSAEDSGEKKLLLNHYNELLKLSVKL